MESNIFAPYSVIFETMNDFQARISMQYRSYSNIDLYIRGMHKSENNGYIIIIY